MRKEHAHAKAKDKKSHKNPTMKAKLKAAEMRRKECKDWQRLAASKRYVRAASKLACSRFTWEIEENIIEGSFISLNERNEGKSSAVKKRILRRIVEKRSGQTAHRMVGNRRDMLNSHLQRINTRKSMEAIHRYRFCV